MNDIIRYKGGTHVKTLMQPILHYITKTMTKRLRSVIKIPPRKISKCYIFI
jgi:hypothetical protein